ncbi:32 kDa beta-galactoside-binding lectin-like [Musca autumnalis]|uniref:32 kDa beta-galactoside-binding lectin-like n=1 Tax=Musca autumnalis TaxID=221902 RepID=UPI003CF191AB
MSALFQGKLIENLSFGHLLQIGGKAESEESWFSISLSMGKCSETETFDTPFHMLVDVGNEKIIFKRFDGQWVEVDSEEYETEKFRQNFRITIAVDENKFYVGINEESFSFVAYKALLTKLSHIRIDGNFMTLKQVDHRKYFSAAWPTVQIAEDNSLHFSHDIPCRWQPGNVMVVTMKLLGKMDGWFKMDFRNSENFKRIEVHINVRFNIKKIIRNSKLPTKKSENNPAMLEWGDEETKGSFPFDVESKPFRLAFGFTNTSLKMAKDGVYLFKYKYRTENLLLFLTGIKIEGQKGMIVRVLGIDNLLCDHPKCHGFERYSELLN